MTLVIGLFILKVRMGKSAYLAEQNSPFVQNRIKPITNFINGTVSISCIPTNDGSVKYIVTVSFYYLYTTDPRKQTFL